MEFFMRRYYFALVVFFIAIYIMPSLMIGLTPEEAKTAMDAYCAYKYEPFSLVNFDSIISGFFISIFGFSKWGVAANGIIALAVLSTTTIYAIKKCTNDSTLAACTYLLFFSSFWIFLLIPDSVIGNSGIWGALINFLGLGAYFMASREERFSVQRIWLLLLCGILTFASLIISGLNPFFFSIIVATVYMLSQKRYVDMLLMPIEIIFVVVLLLSLLSWSESHCYYAWAIHGWASIVTYWSEFFTNMPQTKQAIADNLMLLGMGILPIAPFLLCSVYDFKHNAAEFLKRPIYKFSMIFLIAAIIFSILNNGLTMANLPITYLPFSFLVATGLVNYLRTNNRHKLLGSCFVIIGVAGVLIGTNLLLLTAHLLGGIVIILLGLLLIFTVKASIERKNACYFFCLAMIILITSLKMSLKNEYSGPSGMILEKRIETIVGKNYPENQVQFFACNRDVYHLTNFYLENKVEFIDNDLATETLDHKTVLSCEQFDNIAANSSKEIIVFDSAQGNGLPLSSKANILKFNNLTIYYFKK